MAELVPLVTLNDAFAARILVARLGSDGILCQLRGGMDGPYPVGPVVVLVESDRLDEASELLEVDDELGPPAREVPRSPVPAWAVLAVPITIGAILVVRTFWFVM
ncbi:MAG: DUF2007 domain-containing protein [Actinomycetota bacterium]